MARYEDLSVTLLRVSEIVYNPRSGSTVPSGSTTGFLLGAGTSSAMITDSTPAGSAIKTYINYTGTTGRYTGIWSANYLNAAWASSTQGAGIYAIRGEAGNKASTTMTMSSNQGYLAGVQGKLAINGTTAGNWYLTAGLFQVQNGASAVFGSGAAMYGIWIDNQASGAAWPSGASYMVNITNNGGAVDSFFYFYGNNATTYFAEFGACSGAISASGAGGGTSKYLKCLVDGVAYSILIKSDA